MALLDCAHAVGYQALSVANLNDIARQPLDQGRGVPGTVAGFTRKQGPQTSRELARKAGNFRNLHRHRRSRRGLREGWGVSSQEKIEQRPKRIEICRNR